MVNRSWKAHTAQKLNERICQLLSLFRHRSDKLQDRLVNHRSINDVIPLLSCTYVIRVNLKKGDKKVNNELTTFLALAHRFGPISMIHATTGTKNLYIFLSAIRSSSPPGQKHDESAC